MIAFRDDDAKQSLAGWYPRFLDRIPGPVAQRRVQTRQGETHVLLAGPEDAPPLVVIHGAMASSAHAVSEIGALARRWRIVAPDVIGQSPMSADGRIPLDGAAPAEWLTDVLDGVGVAQAGLLGVSWGGAIAMRAVALAPHRFDRLALLVPAGVIAVPVLPALWNVALPMLGWRLLGREASFDRVIDAIFTTTDPLWSDWIRTAHKGFRMDFKAPPLAKPAEVAAWKGPVLTIAAEHDLSFPGTALNARVLELFPHARTELIAGAKHSPPMTDAFRAWLAERLEGFLAQS